MKVLGMGFNCIDIIRTKKTETISAGGTCTNVLAILSSLGIDTSLLIPNYEKSELFPIFLEDIKKKNVNYTLYKKTNAPFSLVIQDNINSDHRFSTVCSSCGNHTISSFLFDKGDAKKNIDILKKVDLFYCDRFSQGIKYFTEYCNKEDITTFYEPNNCRFYNNQLSAIKNFDVVKFSSSRISLKICERLKSDLEVSNVKLIIVTLGEEGLKFSVRKEKIFSEWIEIKNNKINTFVDSSGAGDCLTAIIIYSFLYNKKLKEDFDIKLLCDMFNTAQAISSINCECIGAQGFLYDAQSFKKACDILNLSFIRPKLKKEEKTFEIRCSICNSIL